MTKINKIVKMIKKITKIVVKLACNRVRLVVHLRRKGGFLEMSQEKEELEKLIRIINREREKYDRCISSFSDKSNEDLLKFIYLNKGKIEGLCFVRYYINEIIHTGKID